MYRFFLINILIGLCLGITITMAQAGDLDDGISKYTDDSISKYDNLGRIDKNIKYTKMRAIGRAKMEELRAKDSSSKTAKDSGQANMNSVILGAGGVIRGDVIIIDESKGPKTQIVDK